MLWDVDSGIRRHREPQPGSDQAYDLKFSPDGSVLAIYPEGWSQRLGQTGPLEGSSICLQAREGLMAVDPLSGRVLWVRTDIGSVSVGEQRPGSIRVLTRKEIGELYKAVGM